MAGGGVPWMLLGHPFRVPILDPVNGLWEPLNNFENFPVKFLIISVFVFVFVFYLYFYFKLEIATKVNSINVMFFLLSLLLQVSSLFLFIIF